MKRIFIISISSILMSLSASAQDELDALRYGFQTYHGTARGMSIGSALGSIGGDFSTLSVNPAGLGVYRMSEFSITPSFQVGSNQTTYLGNTSSKSASKFNLGSFGLVLTRAKKGNAYKRSGWKAASFGFGMNRMATYKNEYTYSGNNFNNSLIDRYADEFNALGGLNNTTLSQVSYPAYAAYQTYLLDLGTGADSNKAFSYVPYTDGLLQRKSVVEKGHIQEYTISVGGNYNQFSLGSYMKGQHFMAQLAGGQQIRKFNYWAYGQWQQSPYEFYFDTSTDATGTVKINGEQNLRFGAGCSIQLWKFNIRAEASGFKPLIASGIVRLSL